VPSLDALSQEKCKGRVRLSQVFPGVPGKKVLARFYAQHLRQTPLSKVVFVFEAARHASRRKSVVTFFNSFFEELQKP
jgi:hypothetical protein